MKLKIDSIEFSYNGRKVLDNVIMELREGEILGLIGPNGSGKSTLLKCINNILEPETGKVFLNDRDLHHLGRNAIARNIGYVPQQETRTFPATVFETVLMGRKPYISWRASAADLEIVSRILKMLKLEDFTDRSLNELSGGERQKVIIGRALAQKPSVLLLDEPTSNLDLKHQLEIMNLIKLQTENGISSIIAIHDLSLAGRYCDKIVLLNEGKIHAAGGLEVLSCENIEPVYGVKVSINRSSDKIMVVPEAPLEKNAS